MLLLVPYSCRSLCEVDRDSNGTEDQSRTQGSTGSVDGRTGVDSEGNPSGVTPIVGRPRLSPPPVGDLDVPRPVDEVKEDLRSGGVRAGRPG